MMSIKAKSGQYDHGVIVPTFRSLMIFLGISKLVDSTSIEKHLQSVNTSQSEKLQNLAQVNFSAGVAYSVQTSSNFISCSEL